MIDTVICIAPISRESH